MAERRALARRFRGGSTAVAGLPPGGGPDKDLPGDQRPTGVGGRPAVTGQE
ncbi:hypothetical protein [Streptodolium elevatio]